uniref:Uncharacterized protein n=1 Tax=Pithovirus LCPAC304 TaxID=2506594 RepID=A0A481Z9W0_9VIRU|nr:MAG: hypothetical protein LCPAC304_02710 [Pithovirus LCPAC304]
MYNIREKAQRENHSEGGKGAGPFAALLSKTAFALSCSNNAFRLLRQYVILPLALFSFARST